MTIITVTSQLLTNFILNTQIANTRLERLTTHEPSTTNKQTGLVETDILNNKAFSKYFSLTQDVLNENIIETSILAKQIITYLIKTITKELDIRGKTPKFFEKSYSNYLRLTRISYLNLTDKGNGLRRRRSKPQLLLATQTSCIRTCQGQHYRHDIACLEQEFYFALPRVWFKSCLLYTSPSPRDRQKSRMPSSA